MYHWKENNYNYVCVFPVQIADNFMENNYLVTNAGKVIISHLIFVHAWSGCDTTSATFDKGKPAY